MTFSLLITDARYSVPTLSLLVVKDKKHAVERAIAALDESGFHLAVELLDDNRPIYRRQKTPDRGFIDENLNPA